MTISKSSYTAARRSVWPMTPAESTRQASRAPFLTGSYSKLLSGRQTCTNTRMCCGSVKGPMRTCTLVSRSSPPAWSCVRFVCSSPCPRSARGPRRAYHIIRICHDNSSAQHLVSAQCVKILEGLVAVILQAENQLITGGQSLVVGGRGGTGVLDPLQEVFERHVQRPAPPGDAQKGLQPGDDNMGQHRNPGAESGAAQVVDPATGFDWDGELSLLADSGLGDASQLWLWADNLNHDSFAEFNDARLRQACYRLAPSTTSRWKSSRMPNKHSPDAGELLEAADEQAICGDSHPTSSTNLIWRGSVLTDTMSCWSRI
ncbi:hypothetical protein J3458_001138 [Metarhizium acridum]|uniref:uncharacterized protein n=1 Tax=Metarhizium acridum TaxID=92637 RepID=UPI001C6BF630|nr:hypothetical protein J3458_001138 [Metarhizium acridum]